VSRAAKLTQIVSVALMTAAAAGLQAQEHEHPGEHGPQGRPPAHGEPHAGPRGYERPTPPHGWDNRPHDVDRGAYQHNFQASRSYHIGVYHRPHGWVARRWAYGEVLPRAYWAPPYILADYWLFGLEIPPAGFEWVRDDTDAILVNVQTGQILQVEYGVFA
jgi:Ni/Co efflux regulator RcnB